MQDIKVTQLASNQSKQLKELNEQELTATLGGIDLDKYFKPLVIEAAAAGAGDLYDKFKKLF